MDGFVCASCGKYYKDLPMDVGFDYPDYWYGIPIDDRESRAIGTPDRCVIDGRYFFVQGCIEIPVQNSEETFRYGVWSSVSEKSFLHISEIRDGNASEEEPPYFGWLSNALSGYPSTLNLKLHVWPHSDDLRPLLELEPTDHPLAVEQREGITLIRIQQIVEGVMHKHEQSEN